MCGNRHIKLFLAVSGLCPTSDVFLHLFEHYRRLGRHYGHLFSAGRHFRRENFGRRKCRPLLFLDFFAPELGSRLYRHCGACSRFPVYRRLVIRKFRLTKKVDFCVRCWHTTLKIEIPLKRFFLKSLAALNLRFLKEGLNFSCTSSFFSFPHKAEIYF